MARQEVQIETILNLFEHQGMVTMKQALSLYPEEITYSSLSRALKKYSLPTEDRPRALLGQSSIIRPWASPTGAPESYFYLTEAGAYEYTKISGRRIDPPNPQAQPKSKQHALALVDIAIAIREKNADCVCNRFVNIKDDDVENQPAEEDKPKKYTKPDIQFNYIGTPDFIQFIEFEHSRKPKQLLDILVARMNRWQDLLASEEGKRYSKNILVLFYLDPEDQEKGITLTIWMRALYRFVELRNGELPNFKIYFKDFREFFNSPTLSIKDYGILEASQDPETYFLRKKNEKYFSQKAKEIFETLDGDLSDKTTQLYYDEKFQVLVAMQNYSARQIYFFDQIKKLHQLSQITEKQSGYSLASVPWVSIGLLRQWVEQPQLRTLRDRLVVGLSEVHNGYLRGMAIAADILDRVMWESIFPYFNFAQGGPLGYFTVLSSSSDGKEKNNRLIPTAKVSSHWEGVCTTEDEAHKIEEAINWMVVTFIQFTGEMGLTKNEKPFMSILQEPITSTPLKKPASRPRSKNI